MLRMNRLAEQKSPYLLQHATNPVDWLPWGDEAFSIAHRQNKPVFLSIGYSTCHWCHVMARESFTDPTTAELLNTHFVNIKVDREELPEVDRIYMAYLHATGSQGGWPLSVWLTPDRNPFYAGTYYPPIAMGNRPSFRQVITAIRKAWCDNQEELERAAAATIERLQPRPQPTEQSFSSHRLAERAVLALRAAFDETHGGFGSAPKFPRPVALELLFQYAAHTGDKTAAEIALFTLQKMANGGIHDRIDGGFHRYSVDERWHVPHFEKMLYDQAQLAHVYVDAFRISGDTTQIDVAHDIFDYALHQLRDTNTGAFFSAEDADSRESDCETRTWEGAFYVWSAKEIDEILQEDAALFSYHYGITPHGNATDPHGELLGKNVLYTAHTLHETARFFSLSEPETMQRLADCRRRLALQRTQRHRPHRDDKIITAWNGMMIAALAAGYAATDRRLYLDAAQQTADFILRVMWPHEKRLYRRFCDDERAVYAGLDDYAQLVAGLIALYQVDFDLRWLQAAETLTAQQIALFYDHKSGAFFSSATDDTLLPIRLKDDHDGAEPAGNSTATMNLLQLAQLVGRDSWTDLARATIAFFAPQLHEMPHAMPKLLVAATMLDEPPERVAIAGNRLDERIRRLLAPHWRLYAPNRVTLLADNAFRDAYGHRMPEINAMPDPNSPPHRVCVSE